MRPFTPPLRGTCLCTETRFELHARPTLTFACHCRDCQKMSASAFSLAAMIPAGGLRITAGAPVVKPRPGSTRRHHHCPNCLTFVFTRLTNAPERVNIRSTLLDAPRFRAPFAELMIRERQPGVATGAVHSFAAYPNANEFAALLRAFPDWADGQQSSEAT